MKKWIKKMWLNDQMELSMTKVGGQLVGMAVGIVALPAMGVAVPVMLLGGSKMILAIGMVLGISGARDALDKTAKK